MNYIKIFIILALTIGGGFSGIFFDKLDLKEKFINFRHAVYKYLTSEA
ncbi:DNA/RNA non-specific endonuclease, partial [Francisella tularensis subsp. holarctica]|nr:DNA/RNA non-specific endonuclease [Francisella tularensis subsp. holarctica]